MRFAKARVRPVLAAVGRLVDAVAGIEVAANVGFPGAGVDDAAVGRRHRKRADRARDARKLSVGDVRPAQTEVGALPDAALDAAHVEDVLARDAVDGDGAAADVRTDAPPCELAHQLRGRSLRLCGIGQGRCDTNEGRECGKLQTSHLQRAVRRSVAGLLSCFTALTRRALTSRNGHIVVARRRRKLELAATLVALAC